jgi:nitroreductase
LNVSDAIRGRASTRAFLDRAVPPGVVREILDTARWAPSGVNTQPWKVAVLGEATRKRLGDAIIAAREAGTEENPDYHYYPTRWDEPYRSRRKASGLALYGALGIGREDAEARRAAWYRNYRFFGAPVGLIFSIDRGLEKGSWVDIGMFIQSVMLAARDHGLDTCPQASLAEYPDIVREILGLPPSQAIVCGMSMGYADPEHPVNRYRTEREPVEAFTQAYD